MRKALIVGIDHYDSINRLYGCVDDAHSVKAVLERHGDGTINFDCMLLTGTSHEDRVERGQLKDSVEALFRDESEIALFYFAGHGYIESVGGYLVTTEAQRGDDGLSLSEIMTYANGSKAKNKIIVLDSCHSGIAGVNAATNTASVLSEGLTVLTASTADQYASEENGKGIFTTLFVDALHGGAANLTGDITPGSIYAHIDQSLGAWEQRPVFKTNVKQFVSLRKVTPPISLEDLRKISEYFPTAGYEFLLDPTFEPEVRGRNRDMPPPNPENVKKFGVLQQYNRLNLLVPVGAPHMWHAAMENKTCKLTALGEHYRSLIGKNRI